MRLIALDIDPVRCFVSHLDTYDVVQEAMKKDENESRLQDLAMSYWRKLIRLDRYDASIRRPEVMITYDVPPSAIEAV